MFLDASSWKILKKKAVDHYMNQRRGQRKQGFFNQLNEAFAYRYLCRRGFRRVRFIQEGAQKTPDIRFSDHGILKCCEVKTIGISDDEIKRRSSNSVFDGSNYISLILRFDASSPAMLSRAVIKFDSVLKLAWYLFLYASMTLRSITMRATELN